MTDCKIVKFIEANDIKFVDLRFTDSASRVKHVAIHVSSVPADICINGLKYTSSDMEDFVLLPDPDTAFLDPFTAQPTLVVLCDVLNVRDDPRGTARRSISCLSHVDCLDALRVAMDLGFFIFDDVRFEVTESSSSVTVDSIESRANSFRKYDYGNPGHRPGRCGAAHMVTQPCDMTNDIRAEMLSSLMIANARPMSHFHANNAAHSVISIGYSEFLRSCDDFQKAKYIVHNVASSYGKTATFMPQPMSGPSFGLRLYHTFVGLDSDTRDVRTLCSNYVGGIIRHIKALNAFANPTINSYRRLKAGNIGSVRVIPTGDHELSVEVLFPDTSVNPYYCNAAILMAGIDGVINSIEAPLSGSGIYHGVYAGSLSEAIESLNYDRSFLKVDNVFTDNQIDMYITAKREDIAEYEVIVTPFEFVKYYSC